MKYMKTQGHNTEGLCKSPRSFMYTYIHTICSFFLQMQQCASWSSIEETLQSPHAGIFFIHTYINPCAHSSLFSYRYWVFFTKPQHRELYKWPKCVSLQSPEEICAHIHTHMHISVFILIDIGDALQKSNRGAFIMPPILRGFKKTLDRVSL